MSWSVSAEGTVPEVVAKLEQYSASLSGQSKEEFDAAMPHLIALAEENRRQTGHASGPAKVRVSGFGSRSTTAGVEESQSCQILVQPLNT